MAIVRPSIPGSANGKPTATSVRRHPRLGGIEHSGATAAQEFPLANRPADGRVVVRKIAALLHKLAPRLQGGPFYCGLSMHAVTSRTSWYEVLPQGLGHSMGAIACVKFDLDLLQVAADRLFTDPECLCHFAVSGPGGDQTQDRDFARRQPSRATLSARDPGGSVAPGGGPVPSELPAEWLGKDR